MENTAHHKLQAWLDLHGTKQNWLAGKIGTRASTLSKWLAGKSKPLPVYRARIEEITGGAVVVGDWA